MKVDKLLNRLISARASNRADQIDAEVHADLENWGYFIRDGRKITDCPPKYPKRPAYASMYVRRGDPGEPYIEPDEELGARVQAAFLLLREKNRNWATLLEVVYIERENVAAFAKAINCSRQNIEKMLRRARKATYLRMR